jgi:adenine-specific DNA methylase
MGKHLRLVVSNEVKIEKKETILNYIKSASNRIKCMFISRNEKIYILKDILIDLYKDYEITTGIIDEPYFIKAEKKIRRIVREKKVDYYYNLLKKFKKNNNIKF